MHFRCIVDMRWMQKSFNLVPSITKTINPRIAPICLPSSDGWFSTTTGSYVQKFHTVSMWVVLYHVIGHVTCRVILSRDRLWKEHEHISASVQKT